MEFVEEEIDIKYEYNTDDLGSDHDLVSSPHSTDWKLNPNVECRVMLDRMKSLDSDKEVEGDPDESGEVEAETSSGHNESVDKSCGVYRKLKLLVDVLKNCEKRENCGLCEKYIHQLQEHLLLTHRNNRGDAHEKISIETTVSASEPISLDRNQVYQVLSENKNMDMKISHGDVDKNSGDELVPSETTRSENEGEPITRKVDPNNINRKSIPKIVKSKPYKCNKCQMTFLTFYELTQHNAIHTEVKRDYVDATGTLTQSYSQQRGLPTGCLKKRFECDICRKAFNKSYDLNRHKRIHTGEKPYKCDMCGKFFTQTYTLSEHKLTHTGEKPHKCEKCGKCFTHYSTLFQHTRTHTGEKLYKCEQCGKCFTHNSYLTKHARTHTGENRTSVKCAVSVSNLYWV